MKRIKTITMHAYKQKIIIIIETNKQLQTACKTFNDMFMLCYRKEMNAINYCHK